MFKKSDVQPWIDFLQMLLPRLFRVSVTRLEWAAPSIVALVVLVFPGIIHSQGFRTGDSQPANPNSVAVARLHYPGGGDWYWGPSALDNLLDFVEKNTNVRVDNSEHRVRPSDEQLVFYPFIFATGHGNIRLTDAEALALRRYLLGGGFWLINDSYGMDEAVRRTLKKIFPDRELVELPFSHPIYHSMYEFPNGPPKIHEHDNKPPQGFAILDGDRVCVFYVYESDIGDGWEDPQVHGDPPSKREAALKMGTNILVYALTN